MKEIWKQFSNTCKTAWNKTVDALGKIFNDFVEGGKNMLVQAIDLLKDIINNTVKAAEVVIMGLVVAVTSALLEAIYDSIMYGLDKLKGLFTKSTKK